MSTRIVWRTAPVGSSSVTQPAPVGAADDEIVVTGPTAVKPTSIGHYTGVLYLAPPAAATISKT